MSYSIDLSEFDLVINEFGNFVIEDGEILIQNRTTKEEIKVVLANVAAFYGLYEEGETTTETPATESTTIEGVQQFPSRTSSPTSISSSTSLPSSPLPSAPPSPTHAGKKKNTKKQTKSYYQKVKIFKWDDNQTKFLLNLYGKYMASVGPFGQFKNKKMMWCFIANKISTRFNAKIAWKQVETRFNVISKRTRKVIDNNNTSGAAFEEMDFGEEMNEIIQRDDSFLLDTGVSPGIMYSKKGSISSARGSSQKANSKSISALASTSELASTLELASTSGLASSSVLTSTSGSASTSRSALTSRSASTSRSALTSESASTSGLASTLGSASTSVDANQPRRQRQRQQNLLQQLVDTNENFFERFLQRKEEYYKEKLKILRSISEDLKNK